ARRAGGGGKRVARRGPRPPDSDATFLFLTCAVAVLFAVFQPLAYSQDEPVPMMTTTLHSPSGSEVSVTYEAIRWNADTFAMLQSATEDEDAAQLRDHYNKYVMPRLGQLSTNVTLKGQSFTLAPGIYRIGFVTDGPKWSFVAGNRDGRQVEVPLTWDTQPFETGNLSFLLIPGLSPDAVQMVILYGPHTVAQGFLLSGEPTQIKETEPPLYKLYYGGVRGEEIQSATPSFLQEDWRMRTLGKTHTPRPDSSLGTRPKRGPLR
ncbi:MAG: hypothetical protein ABIH23_34445, partial [bacterium]